MTEQMKKVGLLVVMLAALTVVFVALIPNQDMATDASSGQVVDEVGVIIVSEGLNKFDNAHLPESVSTEVTHVFGKPFAEMNGENTRLDLTLTFDGNQENIVKVEGAVTVDANTYALEGEGEVIETVYEGETYYRISFDSMLNGIELGDEEFLDGNSAGMVIVHARDHEIFKASLSIGAADKTALLFFGDDHEVAHEVEIQVLDEQGGLD